MVSAGLDTVPGNLIMGIAYLSCPHGQEIEDRAYNEIMAVYPDGDAWEKCLFEEKVPYVTAFVKEVLRFWTVIPISLPRKSIKDIQWQDATIAAGTTFYMVHSQPKAPNLPAYGLTPPPQNAYAANYDPTHFKNPHSFLPDRYLSPTSSSDTSSGTHHYAYGAGSRMCVGSHLANRELYTAFIRLISAFHIAPSKAESDRPILDALECNAIKTSLTTEPRKFKVGFRVRDEGVLERWVRGSEERTRGVEGG